MIRIVATNEGGMHRVHGGGIAIIAAIDLIFTISSDIIEAIIAISP
jgi:hypothetical protein